MRADHAQTRKVADTADSLLKTERAALEHMALQLRKLEADKQTLQGDLGFFQRLLPTTGEGLQLRGLQAEAKAPGQLRYQMLVVQNGKGSTEFKGRYELTLTGQLEGQPWSQALAGGPQVLQIRQVTRVEGMIDHPADAVIKSVHVRVVNAQGATKATQTVRW